MSRIGNNPIKVPDEVDIEIKDSELIVESDKGKLVQEYKSDFEIKEDGDSIIVERPTDSNDDKSLHGLYHRLFANMIEGVTEGYEKVLEISGVGFQSQMKGDSLLLKLGFSHPVLFTPPEGVNIEIPENMVVKVSGVDKQKVGEVAARIRNIYPPEPYKGKGIKYENEKIRRKTGKKVGVE